jgi:hypothetical protein
VAFDGSTSFSGGMDSSREPSKISPEQCVKLVNCAITDTGDKLAPRPGWRCQNLNFASKFVEGVYANAQNFQGEGWSYNGFTRILLACIDGYILKLVPDGDDSWSVSVLNQDDRSNPNLKSAWFTRVGGDKVIMQDGESNPVLISGESYSRIDSSDTDNIGPGKFGAFVQGRYFYADPSGSIIIASNLREPTLRSEGSITNLYGFTSNDVNDRITAMGRQKHLSLDVNGGSLVWSTDDDLYSADVRGDRTGWSASLVVAESGAVSQNSFENFGSNLYYRSVEKGITSFRQSASQFLSDSDLYSDSVEVDVWLSRDTETMLDRCYTESFKNKLFTTVCPSYHPSGIGVFWNGLIVQNPDPSYNSRNRTPRRFEGLWTGVRPWALTELHGNAGPTQMFCHSYDADGKTRLYRLDESSTHDVDSNGNIREIERIIEFRSFDFGNESTTKEVISNQYGIFNFDRPTQVRSLHRPDYSGPWREFWRVEHKAGLKSCECNTLGCYPKQDRPCVVMRNVKDNSLVPGVIPGRKAFDHSYRMEIIGPGELGRFIAEAELHPHSEKVFKEPKQTPQDWIEPDDFRYQIAR